MTECNHYNRHSAVEPSTSNNSFQHTGPGTVTYSWDARNRLTGISAPGLTASFSYDPLGRRSTKTLNGTATSFLYEVL